MDKYHLVQVIFQLETQLIDKLDSLKKNIEKLMRPEEVQEVVDNALQVDEHLCKAIDSLH